MTPELLALRTRVEEHLRKHTGELTDGPWEVTSIVALAGGACQDNLRVELSAPGGPRTLVLRSDAIGALPGSIDRSRELAVISAAIRAGVRTPAAHYPARGLVRDGAHAYFMDWAEGEAIGRKVTKSPELQRARERLPAELATELAKIHRITSETAPELAAPTVLGPAPKDPVAAVLAFQRARIDTLRSPRLGIELVYRWLGDHAPKVSESVLLHGDFRTGNFLVTEMGLSAILDWEFARWGSRYEDLAWISMRDWRFGVLALPVGGFSARAPFYEAYERESGHTVDPKLVHWFEVLSNLGWAIGSVAQAERYIYGGEEDLELLAIGRRVGEMEWEALRLIERGSL
jgi:aminoglycoside phosphotransferase (APT) family kinase protein